MSLLAMQVTSRDQSHCFKGLDQNQSLICSSLLFPLHLPLHIALLQPLPSSSQKPRLLPRRYSCFFFLYQARFLLIIPSIAFWPFLSFLAFLFLVVTACSCYQAKGKSWGWDFWHFWWNWIHQGKWTICGSCCYAWICCKYMFIGRHEFFDTFFCLT